MIRYEIYPIGYSYTQSNHFLLENISHSNTTALPPFYIYYNQMAFISKNTYELRIEFHWSLFPPILDLGNGLAWNHNLDNIDIIHRCAYASLDLNQLTTHV